MPEKNDEKDVETKEEKLVFQEVKQKPSKKEEVEKTPVTGVRVKGGKQYRKYRIVKNGVTSYIDEFVV